MTPVTRAPNPQTFIEFVRSNKSVDRLTFTDGNTIVEIMVSDQTRDQVRKVFESQLKSFSKTPFPKEEYFNFIVTAGKGSSVLMDGRWTIFRISGG